MSEKQIGQVSCLSVHVGATQHFVALNIDLAAVMHAGQWKSTRMPMQYREEILSERILSGRGAMAGLSTLQDGGQ
jgi:hypothetical protein